MWDGVAVVRHGVAVVLHVVLWYCIVMYCGHGGVRIRIVQRYSGVFMHVCALCIMNAVCGGTL